MEPEEKKEPLHDKKEEQKRRKKVVNDLLRSLKNKSPNDLTPKKSSTIDLYDSDKNKDQITDMCLAIWADPEPIDTYPCGEDPDHIHKLYSVTLAINNMMLLFDSMEIEDITDALIISLKKLNELD
jgi:hypothetical protein